MTKAIHGTVQGRTIEFAEELGIRDGQQVEVIIRVIDAQPTWGEGILRSAGGWVDYPEMDEIFANLQEDRK